MITFDLKHVTEYSTLRILTNLGTFSNDNNTD